VICQCRHKCMWRSPIQTLPLNSCMIFPPRKRKIEIICKEMYGTSRSPYRWLKRKSQIRPKDSPFFLYVWPDTFILVTWSYPKAYPLAFIIPVRDVRALVWGLDFFISILRIYTKTSPWTSYRCVFFMMWNMDPHTGQITGLFCWKARIWMNELVHSSHSSSTWARIGYPKNSTVM
jgi:hypothetical protein